MKHLFLFSVLITCALNSFSQKKKSRPLPPPVPESKMVLPSQDTLSLTEYSSPLLFQWEMNADTALKSGTVFKELIKLKAGETEVNSFYSTEPVTLKKVKAGTTSEAKIPKMITGINYYDASISKGIVTLAERGRTVLSLKVVYDKNKQVRYLKNIKNGALYRPIPSDPPPVAAPRQYDK